MRICIHKASKQLIEMQSHATEGTLIQNALNAGYTEDQIEVKWVTDAEWAEIEEANKPVPTYKELRAREYPPMADYLDGIVKGDQAQIDKYIADCLAIKAKYPKE